MKGKFNVNIGSIINGLNCEKKQKEIDSNSLSEIEKIILDLTDKDLMDLASFFNDNLSYHIYSTNSNINNRLINDGLCTREETNNILYGSLYKYTYSLNTEVIDVIKSLCNKGYLTYQSKTFFKNCK